MCLLSISHISPHISMRLFESLKYERCIDWLTCECQIAAYRAFAAPFGKVFLGAVLTYQIIYWTWMKLETDEDRVERNGQLSNSSTISKITCRCWHTSRTSGPSREESPGASGWSKIILAQTLFLNTSVLFYLPIIFAWGSQMLFFSHSYSFIKSSRLAEMKCSEYSTLYRTSLNM